MQLIEQRSDSAQKAAALCFHEHAEQASQPTRGKFIDQEQIGRQGAAPGRLALAQGQPITDLTILLRSLRPVLHPDVYVFASMADGTELPGIPLVATFCEAEGTTIIIEEGAAQRANLPILFRAAWITLTVHPDLAAVGLTAAVAAAFYDHFFVPADLARAVPECLHTLQRQADKRCRVS